MESRDASPHIIAADGRADIVINCGADLLGECGEVLSRRGESVLCTISEEAACVRSGGDSKVFGIRVRNSMLPHFCASSMAGLDSQSIDVYDIFGEALGRALQEAAFFGDAERIASFVDAALGRYVRSLRPQKNTPFEIAPLLELIRQNSGNITIPQLARYIGKSERTIHRAFTAHLGIGAKSYASIVRFNHALQRIDRSKNISLLAQDCGYFDHAHLVRDFQKYGGIAPSNHPLLSDFYKT